MHKHRHQSGGKKANDQKRPNIEVDGYGAPAAVEFEVCGFAAMVEVDGF